MQVTRPQWKDAIKDDARLTGHDFVVAMVIAEFWKTDSAEPLWVANEVFIRVTRLSRAAVFKALKHLRELGYISQVEAARPGRSPRWAAHLAPGFESLQETAESPQETGQSTGETRIHTHSKPTPDVGSKEQDCESRPTDVGPEMTAAQKSDRRKLASYMANYPDETVDLVYGWARTGYSISGRRTTPIGRPGAYAAKRSKLATEVPGISEWQGHFLRHYVKGKNLDYLPETAASADPWATSKSA